MAEIEVSAAKRLAMQQGSAPIHPELDPARLAPKLAEDIRILYTQRSLPATNTYLTFNKIYTASDPDFPELAGSVWVISGIDGWFTLAEPSIPNIERGFGDGIFDVAGKFLSRDITLTGSVYITVQGRQAREDLSQQVRKTLLTAFNLVKKATWFIVDEDQYKRAAYVRLSGRPNIDTVNSRGRVDFSIGLRAADPVKYEWITIDEIGDNPVNEVITGNGYNLVTISQNTSYSQYRDYPYYGSVPDSSDTTTETPTENYYNVYSGYAAGVDGAFAYTQTYPAVGSLTFGAISGTVTLTNHGDANVSCYIRIIGPLYGPAVVTNQTTGQTINILQATTSPFQVLTPSETDTTIQYLDIDTRVREVHKGTFESGESPDSSRGALDPLVDWIYLQPGENTLYFADNGTSSATSTPTFQIYWRSGWYG